MTDLANLITFQDGRHVYPYPRSLTMTAAIFAILFSIVGVIGNLLTTIALLKYKRLRQNATTKFIISLSISDLIFSAVDLPITATRFLYEKWLFGETLCQIFPVFFFGNISVSLLCIMAITINRYLLISKPEIYVRIYTNLGITVMLVFIWMFSFTLLLPSLTEIWGRLGLHPETFACTILPKNGTSPKKTLFIIFFFAPCVIIIVSYLGILNKIKKSRSNIETHIRKRKNSGFLRREDGKVTLLMLIIFLSFLSCYSLSVLVTILDGENNMPTMHVVGSILAWAACVINPFIYAGTNKLYREAYKQILCRKSNETNVRPRYSYSSKISSPQPT